MGTQLITSNGKAIDISQLQRQGVDESKKILSQARELSKEYVEEIEEFHQRWFQSYKLSIDLMINAFETPNL